MSADRAGRVELEVSRPSSGLPLPPGGCGFWADRSEIYQKSRSSRGFSVPLKVETSSESVDANRRMI